MVLFFMLIQLKVMLKLFMFHICWMCVVQGQLLMHDCQEDMISLWPI